MPGRILRERQPRVLTSSVTIHVPGYGRVCQASHSRKTPFRPVRRSDKGRDNIRLESARQDVRLHGFAGCGRFPTTPPPVSAPSRLPLLLRPTGPPGFSLARREQGLPGTAAPPGCARLCPAKRSDQRSPSREARPGRRDGRNRPEAGTVNAHGRDPSGHGHVEASPLSTFVRGLVPALRSGTKPPSCIGGYWGGTDSRGSPPPTIPYFAILSLSVVRGMPRNWAALAWFPVARRNAASISLRSTPATVDVRF